MLKKLLITLLLLPLLAKAQLPSGQDTTLRIPNTVVTPQYRYANYNGLRIPYIYNPTLAKYDALVTMKYANAWFAPFSSVGYVPYTGATGNVSLGIYNLSLNSITSNGLNNFTGGFYTGATSEFYYPAIIRDGTTLGFNNNITSTNDYTIRNSLNATPNAGSLQIRRSNSSQGIDIFSKDIIDTDGNIFLKLPSASPGYLLRSGSNANQDINIGLYNFTATRLITAVQGGGSLDLFGNTITNPGNTGSNISFNANLSLASDNTIALNSGGYINLNTPIVTITQAPSLATVGQILVRDTTTGQAGRVRQLPLSYFVPSTSINGTQNTIVKYGATGITNSRAIDDGTNFGIGGTPLAPLHVFGIESRLQGSSPFYSFYDQTTGLRSGYVQGSTTAMVFATTNSTQPFNFLVGGTLRARINLQGLQLGSIGATNALLQLTPGFSVPAFSTVGRFFNAMAGVLTDSTSAASATITNASVNTFGIPTIRALNTGVSYTNMGNVVIDGSPLASTNITITNPYSLWVKAGNVRLATYGVGIAHFDANGVVSSSTIATADIANNAVTYGKMQSMTANRLLGSGASGTVVAEMTLGSNLSFSANTLNVTGIPTTTDYVTTNTTQTGLSGNKTWTGIHTFNNLLNSSFNFAAGSLTPYTSISGRTVITNNYTNGGGETDYFAGIGSAGTVGGHDFYGYNNAGTVTLLARMNGTSGAFTNSGVIAPGVVNISANTTDLFARYDNATRALVSSTATQTLSDLGAASLAGNNTFGGTNTFNSSVIIAPTNQIYFMNSGFQGAISTNTLTASTLYKLPNASGTIALESTHIIGAINVTPKVINYTYTASDYTIQFDCTGGALLANLPAVATVPTGIIYNVKKTDVSVNTLTITPNGAELIDGGATVIIAMKSNVQIQSTGTGWIIL